MTKLKVKLAKLLGFRHLPFKSMASPEGRNFNGWAWVYPKWVYGNGKWSLELPSFRQILRIWVAR